ncbi:16S rRNA (guanine(527)-N(7))-methyltransferase RsmG [Amorphus sp. 3PC139-8]|uniref:16S rRNA (guanine(527)-N(7))-methyltransferase RsmG n=1 Tax=Amorphus sp. 3PC139-8 TaxID=2735676 RepID=UPI00345C6C46
MSGSAVDGPELVRDALPAVSRETLDRFATHVELLNKWQRVKNLVSPASLDHVWQRHVFDSAQLLRLCPDARRIVDLGSGAGFPGLVLAAMLAETPGARVDLVESNARKAAFLRAVASASKLPAVVHAGRLEVVAPGLSPPVDLVTARALASLSELIDPLRPLLAHGGVALLHKGAEFEAEIAEARTRCALDLVIHESLSDPAGRILEIRGIGELAETRDAS